MEQSKNWSKWLDKAKDDLLWSEAGMKEEVFYGACFSAQQAGEKALKSYLLFKDVEPRRIHDLSGLLEECIEMDKNLEELLNQAATLAGYYVETRYPDIGEFMGYTKEQAKEALDFARQIVNFVEKLVRK